MLSLVSAMSLFLMLAPRLCIAFLVQESQKELFLNETKFGTIVFKTMLAKGLDVVPINPLVPESQGVPCLSSLSDLVDPARTAISVVTQPAVTLDVLHQAQELGIFAVWLQPGAEDASVLDFIASANVNGSMTTYIHSIPPREGLLGQRTESPCGSLAKPDILSTLLS
ncbi:CoA binding domain-containing protein [Roridomyces roridus]|uniref:CoA binding domain-containing protein n=1 Tax=Roridomyces roridus TaxID=1738132 RepID=A0AAD7BYZ7_9AGAR|nr:CoA binding domain-containing protein [Roridomyces roridus]